MNPIIIFIIGVIVGVVLVRASGKCKTLCGGGVYNNQQSAEKENRKAEIMRMFEKQEEVGNDAIERLLGVSDTSATLYCEELEREGKIRQMGKVGRGVVYRKI